MKQSLKLLPVLLFLPLLASAQAGMTLRTAKIVEQAKASIPSSSSPLLRSVAAPAEKELGVTLSVLQNFDTQNLENIGVKVGTHIGNVVTLRATPSQLREVINVEGVTFVSADNRARPKLNLAVPLVKADSVQRGLGGLSQAYTGSDVVVGIIDFGFDYTHPTFYDSLGNLRIVRVWNQSDTRGSSCVYKYGAVYTSQELIEQKMCSSSEETHGTHVAGIAAGGGGQVKKYKGVAPGANLVLVQLASGSESELIDGLSYIFSYAQSVGKPAVVNLSLGMQFGPHDGTSTFDQALDNLVGPGRVVVGSAGNEGDQTLHANYTFSSANNTVRTVLSTKGDANYYIAWADAGNGLEWNAEVWDIINKTKIDSVSKTFYTTANGGSVKNKRFLYNNNRDTVTINAAGYNSYANVNRGIVDIEVTTNTNSSKYGVVLALRYASGTVNLWNLGDEDENYGTFSSLNTSGSTWITGNTDCTIGEIGSTAKKIISVGAYRNVYNSAGRIVADFSSKGPTTDGRTKPDIIAPGSWLISSVNSCDYSYTKNGSSGQYIDTSEVKNGKTYYYAYMQGTSMAAPMVTGAVALLLQECPTLTPDSARSILQRTALVDAAISSTPANTRGFGKLDVLKAVKSKQENTCGTISVKPFSDECTATSVSPSRFWAADKNMLEFSLIPNPNNGTFHLETDESETLMLNVYSLSGTLLHSEQIQPKSEVSLQYLPQGVYLIQLSKGEKQGVKKMLIRR